MTKDVKQRECLIRDREEIKVTSTKTITVTRCGEWGRKHAIVIEEKTSQTIITKRIEYVGSQQCIKDYIKTIRKIKNEYKNVMS